MNTLEAWTAKACEALDLDPAVVDRDLILQVAADVAHGVARPAAPLTTFLVGLAVGRSGGDAGSVRDLARRVQDLADVWSDEEYSVDGS